MRERPAELRGQKVVEQDTGTVVKKESSAQPTVQKPGGGTKEATQIKRLPELSGLEISEQGAWQAKEVRTWNKGDIILNTYKVEEVKKGGMGYVYITEHQGWKVKIAIKSPNEMMLSDRSLFSRVLREADAWTGLGLHPHIAYCYYVRQIEDVPHIFIEYVDGGSLREWIADGRCHDLKTGLDMAIQFCHGMEHAHGFGMIHRDVKPENILMTKEGMLKVTDFGIAGGAGGKDEARDSGSEGEGKRGGSIGKREENLTTLGTVIGTYDYMSPEQFEDPHNVDARADIYSFGVCMYEMFFGRRPYEFTSIEARKRGDKPYEPADLRKDIPPELALLLKKCCQLERDGRYTSFGEIRKELIRTYHDLFHEEPPHAEVKVLELKADGLNNRAISYLDLGREDRAIECWQEALKEDPQHLEATFNLGYFRWQRAEITDDVYVTQMQELKNSKGSDPDYWRCLAWIHFERGDVEAVDKIQKSEYRVEDETFKMALEDKNRPVSRLLLTFEGHYGRNVYSVCFSPDGRYILSGANDKNIRLWDIENGKEIKQFEGEITSVYSICFSPDGRYVISGNDDNTIRLWDVKSGREIRQFKGLFSERGKVVSRGVCFSPDGRYVLLTGSLGGGAIMLCDVASGKEVRRFIEHEGCVNVICFSPDGRYLLAGTSMIISLWDIEGGRSIRQFDKAAFSVSCSPNGRYVLSGGGGGDNTVRLWDIESGKEIKQFLGHTGYVNSVCFSPCGHYALSGSWDHTVRLWDIESGREIRRFEGHTDCVNSLSFSPDGRYLVSGSRGRGNIRLWEIYYPRENWGGVHPYPLLSRAKSTARLSIEKDKVYSLLKAATDNIKRGSFQKAYFLLREGQSIPSYERNNPTTTLSPF